jgi:hypothetical protein
MPIDRPLSRAYLRGFTGWSTAYPPGQSEPTSLRIMENVMVNRNGALCTRPGLRFLAYYETPDMSATTDKTSGSCYYLRAVGGQEPFYTIHGDKALLFAVREEDKTVGFRAILMTEPFGMIHALDDPKIGMDIPQGFDALNFSERTTHVEYVQINNRIIAMSDAGEEIRVFFVGLEKVAKRMTTVTVPEWTDPDKLNVFQPSGAWITAQSETVRNNVLINPSFQIGTYAWAPQPGTKLSSVKAEGHPTVQGTRTMKVESLPQRTNMINYPLHDLGALADGAGVNSWYPLEQFGHDTQVAVQSGWLRITENQVTRDGAESPFLAYSSKAWENVKGGKKYRVSFDVQFSENVQLQARLSFYTVNNVQIAGDVVFQIPLNTGRWWSDAVQAPEGTISMRVWYGGTELPHSDEVPVYVEFKDVTLCEDGELIGAMSGDSGGGDFYWTGIPGNSASVYHPPRTVEVRSARSQIPQESPLVASMYLQPDVDQYCSMDVLLYDRNENALDTLDHADTFIAGDWTRAEVGSAAVPTGAVMAELRVKAIDLARGDGLWLDAGMLEPGTDVTGDYFDGSTAGTPTTANNWVDRFAPHASPSRQRIRTTSAPDAATPKANSLIKAGGSAENPYKMAFFYTFENEIGESAPSRIVEIRMQRPWANWLWETPLVNIPWPPDPLPDPFPPDPLPDPWPPAETNQDGQPSGTHTDVAEECADQLMIQVPYEVYTRALAEGAVKWHLYALAWSDEDPVPVVGDRVATTFMYDTELSDSLPYLEGGYARITPNRRVGTVSMALPSLANRVNYSIPPRSRNGLVAGDRMILVGDPTELGTIKWTSNSFGEYTNFSATTGGGEKTLTSGNLNLPVSVVLWQNPQSVDTITILCQGEDGYSSCHYMQPASIQGGSGTVTVMGFEETTNTPGTVSPYAAEVMNNALFRPTKSALLKSSATNYNINHKTFSDKIANMWHDLQSLPWTMSANLDNRLYLLVNNPWGAPLEKGCKGNEIWVLDIQAENGTWSRFLIQALALRAIDVGTGSYMGVTRPEGLFYLDPDYRRDDVVPDMAPGGCS